VGEACLWLLIIGVAVVAMLWVAARLRLIVLPIGLALVLATFLTPISGFLQRRGWPPAAAALSSVVGFILALAGTILVIAPQAVDQFEEFDVSITAGIEQVQDWLTDGPLGLSEAQIESAISEAQEQIGDSTAQIVGGALSGAVIAVELVAGLLLAFVLLFFFLKDGPRIWSWVVSLFAPRRRHQVDQLGRRSWGALAGFLRGQTVVAAFDAFFIGLALIILGVPLVLPLVVITFFGAYIPILGAFVAGLAAVLVALVDDGIITALLVLGAIIFVQQVESNVLAPVVVGRAVHVHPIGVLLSVTAGGVLAGIIGAMVATPLLAMAGAVLGYLRSPEWELAPSMERGPPGNHQADTP
jgi:putative heme transporter